MPTLPERRTFYQQPDTYEQNVHCTFCLASIGHSGAAHRRSIQVNTCKHVYVHPTGTRAGECYDCGKLVVPRNRGQKAKPTW